MRAFLGILTLQVLCLFTGVAFAAAQTPARTARLIITAVDPSGAVLAGASVTVTGLDDTTRAGGIRIGQTGADGRFIVDALPLGGYSVQVTFAGFQPGLIRSVRLNAGDNRHAVLLPLRNLSDAVTVATDARTASSDRGAVAFGLALTTDQIASLSDDPGELSRQILEMAGPDAIIRVDSFEGASLPPKSQIKSIHVTRDQFAAETDQPGGTFVDIVTQPGIGALSGTIGLTSRADRLTGTDPFVSARQPQSGRNFNGNVGGTLLKDRADFSVSLFRQRQTSSPILNQPGRPARILDVTQAFQSTSLNGLLNYAVTRDQVLRIRAGAFSNRGQNQGIGLYDDPERAFTTSNRQINVAVQEAGPIGRRMFQNTRVNVFRLRREQTSAVELPTIDIQDDRTSGGAQVRGSTTGLYVQAASDLDYIRGIHSWRAGVQIFGETYDSDMVTNYLGTYTFKDRAAYEAGQPLLYTRTVGDPVISYWNVQGSVYVQDDLRVSKSLTLSPGVRYTVQSHVADKSAIGPRFGATWSPFASGRTALRSSIGLFYWPMEMPRLYEQLIRYDGHHQQQMFVVNPSYPDPGPLTSQPQTLYRLGDFRFQRTLRYSAGIDQRVSARTRVSVLYAYNKQFQFWRGRNLNAPVNGVRPDPTLGNVIEALTDAQLWNQTLTTTLTVAVAPPSPALNAARFNWRRMSLSATYVFANGRQNGTGGPFVVPPTGDLSAEWGPTQVPYRVMASLTSTQLRNLNVNISWTTNAGGRYTETTGFDDNLDGILNDRPAGVEPRSLMGSRQANLNVRGNYTLLATRAQAPGTAAGRRYRLALTVNATNLTNRPNYGGFSGNLLSPFFRQPTFATGTRRVDIGFTLGF